MFFRDLFQHTQTQLGQGPYARIVTNEFCKLTLLFIFFEARFRRSCFIEEKHKSRQPALKSDLASYISFNQVKFTPKTLFRSLSSENFHFNQLRVIN